MLSTKPNHKHSPSAVRFVIEGEGGFTGVGGEKLPMERGDLILTPSGLWHQHGQEGHEPVIWLDALDLPTVLALEASYARLTLRNPSAKTPAYLFQVDDAPLQRKLRFYEVIH